MREDCERISFACVFAYVVGKNPKTPNLSPMADDAITRDGIGGLGPSVYIYDVGLQGLPFDGKPLIARLKSSPWIQL